MATKELAPHSVEAEEAVIGGILINATDDPAHLDYHAAARALSPSDFFIVRNGWVFEAFADVIGRGENIDPVSVCEALKDRGRLDKAGGPAYLNYLINHTPTGMFVNTYVHIVKRASTRRRLQKAGIEIVNLAEKKETTIEDILSEAEQALHKVTFEASGLSDMSMGEAMQQSYLELETIGENPAVSTGFSDLDALLNGGFRNKQLVVVCGRPGQGKTAAALNMAKNAKRRVGIVSFEMGPVSLAKRYQAMLTGVSLSKLYTGALSDLDWARLASGLANEDSIWIEDQCKPTFQGVADVVTRWKKMRAIDMVIVDHLHLMHQPKSKSELESYTYITRNMKRLAMDLDIPVILLAQLNRGVEDRKDKHPRMSDLRASGSTEQDADIIIGVHRPETYDENTSRANQMDLQVLKHRNGPTGMATLYFEKELTRLSDIGRVTTVSTSGDHFEVTFYDTFSSRTHED